MLCARHSARRSEDKDDKTWSLPLRHLQSSEHNFVLCSPCNSNIHLLVSNMGSWIVLKFVLLKRRKNESRLFIKKRKGKKWAPVSEEGNICSWQSGLGVALQKPQPAQSTPWQVHLPPAHQCLGRHCQTSIKTQKSPMKWMCNRQTWVRGFIQWPMQLRTHLSWSPYTKVGSRGWSDDRVCHLTRCGTWPCSSLAPQDEWLWATDFWDNYEKPILSYQLRSYQSLVPRCGWGWGGGGTERALLCFLSDLVWYCVLKAWTLLVHKRIYPTQVRETVIYSSIWGEL